MALTLTCIALVAQSSAAFTRSTITMGVSRRTALEVGAATVVVSSPASPSLAAPPKRVLVAGATGQTGRRIVERLSKTGGVEVTGGVRNVEKATKSLAETSIAVRGAMLQKVDSVSPVDLVHLDVVEDSAETLAATLEGYDALVIATGFVPGNPFKMDAAAHAVDNVGNVKLVDAAKKSGVSKIVMISSILTNGRAWGQENSPGFQVTNAFGHVLDEKIVAENHLRASAIDYTIVRPGGLKAAPPTGGLLISGEDTLNRGEISRDFVADVCVAALGDPKASNRVVEIVEDDAASSSLVKVIEAQGKRVKLTLWDTAGQERFRTLTSSYYRGAQGVILVYDVTRPETFENLRQWLREVETYTPNGGADVVKLLVGNKVDRPREVRRDQPEQWARAAGMLFLESSAKDNVGVAEAFEEVVHKILDNPVLLASTTPGAKKRNVDLQDDRPHEPRGCCG
ncbi:hypothetical protein CTAYLR_006843 [Chrysophaeum taylorii]|uniref:NAD(P)-binding domain-containing protein n=1 Tax=Chrysophaeum taylorii TaxID=2483200 RepID=A0AAD7U7C8_9STRA|nr:hypothetical protein CTAYLR_006843 [Chrysophaeum taylorii]